MEGREPTRRETEKTELRTPSHRYPSARSHARNPPGSGGRMTFERERMADHVVDELYGYTAGHLSHREVSRVEEHLRQCADCRKEADELDRLNENLSLPSA